MTVEDFLAWSEEQPDEARYELVAGAPLRLLTPTNIRHARIRRNASDALRAALWHAAGRVKYSTRVQALPLVWTATNAGSPTS